MVDYTTNSAGTVIYSHQDRLGSTILTTDANGNELEAFKYSPYGQAGEEGTTGFPFRYTGQKLDPETGLYYYKARYYDPSIGRFLQTDPIGYEDQMNLYAYVGNDPVNFIDPFGLCRVVTDDNGNDSLTECDVIFDVDLTSEERKNAEAILDKFIEVGKKSKKVMMKI